MRKSMATIGISAMSIAVMASNANASEVMFVSAETLNMRSEPNSDSDKVGNLLKGDKVTIIEKTEYWSKVKTDDGKTGWISSDYLESSIDNEPEDNEPEKEYNETAYVSNSNGVNVREKSSMNSKLMLTIPKNTEVTIIEKNNNGWNKVRLENGSEGWVINNRLSKEKVPEEKVPEEKEVTTAKESSEQNEKSYIEEEDTAEENKNLNKDSTVDKSSAFSNRVKVKYEKGLNVRKESTVSSAIITTIPKDEVIEAVDQNDSWTKIKLHDGRTGWVSSDGISADTDSKDSDKDNLSEKNESDGTKEIKEYNIARTSSKNVEKLKVKVNGSLNVRSGAGTGNAIIGSLKNGSIVERMGISGSWMKIKMSNGKTGWVDSRYLVSLKAPETRKSNSGVKLKVKVNGSLNVRSGPGTGNAIIGSLKNGSTVERIGKSGSWIKIKMSNGKTGWADSRYLVSSESSGSHKSEGAVKLKVKVSGSLNVRSGAGTGNAVVGSLKNGNIVEKIGKSGSWIKIKMSNGKTGWVDSRYLVSLSASDSQRSVSGEKLKVKVSGSLNVRSGPGMGNAVIGSLKNGNTVERIGISGSWSKIKMPGGKTGWVNSQYLSSNKSENEAMNGGSSSSSRNVVSIAKSKLGCKYRWGATGPNEFDCSGFTQWVFRQAGKNIPRVSRDQAKGGKAVSKSQMQPGDIVYFDTMRNKQVSHVGIYLGGNQFIHCSGTQKNPKYVMISSLNGFYGDVFLGARRY